MTERLDARLVRSGLARSRAQARELLDDGVVLVDGTVQRKPSTPVPPGAEVGLTREPEPWVGRAAHKLLGALRAFGPDGLAVAGRRCLDVGASTGGFTQVLLEAGAAHVTALDVGHGQLVPAIAADPRVEERSGTNIRDVAPGDLGAPYGVVVADLSFISLRLALAPMAALAAPDADLVVLVKPQFEVGRERLGRTGVVTSVQQRHEAVRGVLATAVDLGLHPRGLAVSPIRGGDGNREYLLWVTTRTDDPPVALPDLADLDALEASP
ncbi:TlyA family RNA methyltransferase [Lapillicoccus jejuensis]|uniref:23S rRNA (Cytidine1920-2'-O)/16S rRNA (Cytidine1409-2'-O)-methyltransferase n=1 Tax=Lapillicoccus jejuensis TaxID=402171 RepID=A0A542E6L4_9MICO|nr:TlyA family RNA methyltransferase [Lapillicoccus jejuensis]TQJ10975.1 23S rRNA (cytidine1920-2'-O)/16S rRNA (cytidine1409-2'-O)-methyltransferase [Lapillicoccus jejuensis]